MNEWLQAEKNYFKKKLEIANDHWRIFFPEQIKQMSCFIDGLSYDEFELLDWITELTNVEAEEKGFKDGYSQAKQKKKKYKD